MSILFPTIFADALCDLGDMAKSAAAILMFVAFSGTGVFALLAVVSAPQILHLIMVLPALCFAGITVLSQRLSRTEERPAQPRSMSKT
jgi:FHS family L-fucose permease-like MFS transporter